MKLSLKANQEQTVLTALGTLRAAARHLQISASHIKRDKQRKFTYGALAQLTADKETRAANFILDALYELMSILDVSDFETYTYEPEFYDNDIPLNWEAE